MSFPIEIVIFGPFAGASFEVFERPFSSSSFNLGSVFVVIGLLGDLVDEF
ncbi:hypothetical protein N0824_03631 [Microcystis sp. 0824]|nr:hypothetical protein N0824_03631 [Microcystis sp. 0824]